MAADLMRRTGMASFLAGFAIALPALLAAATSAAAEIFPSRPVTMMVGNPPGGPTDTLARIIADAMHGPLGQPVVVETLSGASGTIAAGRVAHARPDGYTIGARTVDHQRNTKRDRRSARCRGDKRIGQSRRATAARNPRPSYVSARPARSSGACGLSQGGDRQMVADHQGRRHQGRIASW